MKKVDLSYLYVLFSYLGFYSLELSSVCGCVHCYEITAFELCVQYTHVCACIRVHVCSFMVSHEHSAHPSGEARGRY